LAKLNSRELARYLDVRIKEESILTDLREASPNEDELEMYIEQYKLRNVVGDNGIYSKWSNRFDCNIWIKDK
jgi:hypothetical protein